MEKDIEIITRRIMNPMFDHAEMNEAVEALYRVVNTSYKNGLKDREFEVRFLQKEIERITNRPYGVVCFANEECKKET